MDIPDEQLERWCQLPDPSASAKSYASIKNQLERRVSKNYKFDTYLQGSYANHTNIRSDSDVDVVVELESSFLIDRENLSAATSNRIDAEFSDADHGWRDFRSEVLIALSRAFTVVDPQDKAIKVHETTSRLSVDVLVAQQWRHYIKYPALDSHDLLKGVTFWPQSRAEKIINYPRRHKANGESKNSEARTCGNYKRSVRMFKSARNVAVDRGLIGQNVAPSYFVECLLFNVPDERFHAQSSQLLFLRIISFLLRSDFSGFTAQNQVHALFGPDSTQWSMAHAREFCDAAWNLWESWT